MPLPLIERYVPRLKTQRLRQRHDPWPLVEPERLDGQVNSGVDQELRLAAIERRDHEGSHFRPATRASLILVCKKVGELQDRFGIPDKPVRLLVVDQLA